MSEHRREPEEIRAEIAEEVQADRKKTIWKGLGYVALVVTLVALMIAVLWINASAQRAQESLAPIEEASEVNAERVEQNGRRVDQISKILERQVEQFERCKDKPATAPGCSEPVAPEPEELPSPVKPVDPPPVVDTMSDAEVRAIVRQEMAARNVSLTDSQVRRIADVAADQLPAPEDGEDGEPGRPPTEDEVRAVVQDVVAAVIAANPPEDGEDGEQGPQGVEGPPGPQGVPGERGPGPSDEQVDAGIARYCSQQPGGSCEGTPGQDGQDGTDGADGEDGAPGRGIASVTGPVVEIDAPDPRAACVVTLHFNQPPDTHKLYFATQLCPRGP